jgi:hypothetical protein
MNTLALDLTTWDLFTDAYGNIAVASDPYSVAQDVASACQLFQGDYWYDVSLGVPYFQSILGQLPSLSFVKAQLVAAASTVPGCSNPVVYLTGLNAKRGLTGQVQFTDSNGATQVVGF